MYFLISTFPTNCHTLACMEFIEVYGFFLFDYFGVKNKTESLRVKIKVKLKKKGDEEENCK